MASQVLAKLIGDTVLFLRTSFIPTFCNRGRSRSGGITEPWRLVSSPVAGAIPISEVSNAGRENAELELDIRIGCINPGRTGFACLGTGHVLWT